MYAPNPLAKTLGTWLLLMFALVMSSAAWAQRDDGQYQILQAVYGTDQRVIDVTDRLKQLAARDQRFKLTNDLFNNVDPAPGQRKTLQIHTRGYGDQPHILEFAEGSWIDAARLTGTRAGQWNQGGRRNDAGYGNDAGNGRVTVQRALYGDGYRQVDVTARLRSQVRDGRLQVSVDNHLAGIDPAPGARKSLTVEFTLGNGPVLQTTAQEGQWLRLP